MQALLDADTVSADLKILVTKTAIGNLALSKSEMAYYHIAQGTDGVKDGMATFWAVCNSGVSLIPPQDESGKMYDFVNSGLYDALFVIAHFKKWKNRFRSICVGMALSFPSAAKKKKSINKPLIKLSIWIKPWTCIR